VLTDSREINNRNDRQMAYFIIYCQLVEKRNENFNIHGDEMRHDGYKYVHIRIFLSLQ